MPDIRPHYNTLRNRLRKLELSDSLAVIHAYAANLCCGKPIPQDIQTPTGFRRAHALHEKHVLPWELETLTAEVLLHTPKGGRAQRTLRLWSYFSETINRIRDLDGALVREYEPLYRTRILHELFRMAHRQFPWQDRGTKDQVLRYLRLYSHPMIRASVHSATGLTVDEIFTIGLALEGHLVNHFAAVLPLTHSGLRGITSEKLDRFLGLFSTDVASIRSEIAASQRLDQDYFYAFNPLRAKPLIVFDTPPRLFCPLPPLLLNAFTDGLYYRLTPTPAALVALGSAFQQHVGDVLEAANRRGALTLLPEVEYRVGRDRKDTVDWVARDETGMLFVEVKTMSPIRLISPRAGR